MSETNRFLQHTKQEQIVHLNKRISSIDEYWQFRMGTSAVGIVVAMQE
jgi:hypothetical protein